MNWKKLVYPAVFFATVLAAVGLNVLLIALGFVLYLILLAVSLNYDYRESAETFTLKEKRLRVDANIKPPIFVYSEGYIDVFSSREMAEAYQEAQFVAELEYKAYDGEGYELEVTITPNNFVAINPIVPPVNKADELRPLIQEFLRIGKTPAATDEWLANATFEELVAKASEYTMR